MKNTILLLTLIAVSFSNDTFAQGDTRQIRKEVQLEMIDDNITLTITTTDGAKVSSEVFTGEEAEMKLAELEKIDEEKIVSRQEVKEEINIEEIDGLSRVTIRRIENGNVTEEVLTGEEADKKIKDLEVRENR